MTARIQKVERAGVVGVALDGRGVRVALLRSRFHAPIVDGLVAGAREALRESGAREAVVFDVPGAFELPLAARAAATSGRFDAVVALGVVIRGETDHYEHIARESASGIAQVMRETGVPIGFGVLTVDALSQARRRAAPGLENKGRDAARAAIEMVRLLRRVGGARKRPAAGRNGRKPRNGRSRVR